VSHPKNKANVKLATLLAQEEEWSRATEIFENVAKSMVDNNLLKFSAKEYFLKAGLCVLASGNAEDAKIKAARYGDEAPNFRDTREAKLLEALADACLQEGDGVDDFTQTVKEYDAISKLDGWMTQILLTIKKTINSDNLL